MKCIEDEIPFEVPEGWEWCRFNSIIDVRDGTHDTPAYVDKGIPLITSKNLIEGGIDYSNVKYISEKDALSINERSGVNVGDILFAMIGTIGNPSMVTEDILISIKNVALFKFSFSDNLSNYFIMYYLDYAQEDMKKRPSGGLQPFVSLNYLRTYLVPIPPIEEQHRIVSILTDSINSIRNIDILKNELAISLEKAKSKILDLAIRGKLVPQDPNDEPASVLLERIRTEKEELIKQGKIKRDKKESVIFRGDDNSYYETIKEKCTCIDDELPLDIPENWIWSKIDSIAFVTKLAGFEYTKNIAPNLCEKGVPLFKGKNVQDSTIIYEFEAFIPEEVSDELSRSQITRKCILTPYVGTIGNIGIHSKPGKYHLGSNVGKIELYNENSTLLEEYVVAYLQSSYGYQQLTKHMKATAQPSISIEAIRDVYIPIPPENEQKKIVLQLNAISSKLEVFSKMLL